MNGKRILVRLTAITLFLLIAVISCKKDDEVSNNSYYVSSELSVPFTKTYITALLNTVTSDYPEISSLIPLVKSDINIFKMVYKTTVDGKEINASGLVCVPSTPGDYPVLSFQNGTNTVNAYAPSEFPLNYPYQFIEVIASMGYIVVIADYPGFGESLQIPHPYLIKEPTVQSLVDMLYATREFVATGHNGITAKNEFLLLGYSQGGWATLALHKALELDYADDFNLKGSACGAGSYNIGLLLEDMVKNATYPMPIYIGFIVNAYSAYHQFTNPVTDIIKEPYASKLGSLYDGLLNSDQINSQLTTSIPGLITADYLSGYKTAAKFSTVRDALASNSISAWHSYKPLYFVHGANDTSVNPLSTQNIYSEMLNAGTSSSICTKEIVPGVDHGDGIFPCMIKGIKFLFSLK
jgi:pimeloyl-ACP methyl ester carboxylesterase